ncbi:MAG TPA: 3-oxoacyl-ACP reductase [Polyangiaceae bacterium]|jgi:3-oxoacyl-[acyl-carrier protein] reductase
MGDLLLDVAQNRQARNLIKSLGLPIPLPEKLTRERGPWTAAPLRDKNVFVGATDHAQLLGILAETLAPAGADPYLDSAERFAPFKEAGETFGRPPRAISALPEKAKVGALVFDASGIDHPASLRAVYDFFHAHIGRLARSGRVVVLGRPQDESNPAAAAAQAALEGFVRSTAKEMGRIGATANLVLVEPGAEGRLAPVLRFVLSPRSAYITAQPLHVTTRARGGAEPVLVRSLEKKVALVTGAARGIGNSIAHLLAQEGAHVVCLDRPADDAATSQLAREIGGTPLLLDISAEDAPAKIAEALRALGGVDIVVHNAGITRDKTLARMKEEIWDQVLDVNLAAVLRVTEALQKDVLKDGGRIICLSSIAGLAGNVGQTNYSASKAGIAGYVRALAPHLADRGITVNAIAPGFIETRMTAAIPLAIREAARRMSALAQGGQPEDVAQAIVFLATPGSQGITGRTLRVCGGSLVGA